MESDTAPVHGLVAELLQAAPGVLAMRDATRGGVATIGEQAAVTGRVGPTRPAWCCSAPPSAGTRICDRWSATHSRESADQEGGHARALPHPAVVDTVAERVSTAQSPCLVRKTDHSAESPSAQGHRASPDGSKSGSRFSRGFRPTVETCFMKRARACGLCVLGRGGRCLRRGLGHARRRRAP